MLIQNYFETRLELIETQLRSSIQESIQEKGKLRDAINYAVFSGGKRWRPLLAVATYEMLRGIQPPHKLESALKAAAAIEIIHNASILHDDLPCLMNKKERRGKEAVHQKFDNTIAILAGDSLITLSFGLLASISDARKANQCIKILSKSSNSYGIIGGQVVDLLHRRKVMKLNTLRYIDMKKVGALLQASTDMACVLAGSDENTRQILNTYAMNLGLAYQMIEDIVEDYGSLGDVDIDFEEYNTSHKSGYAGLLGFDKARKQVEKLLDDSIRAVRNYDNNEILIEFVQMIKDRIP